MNRERMRGAPRGVLLAIAVMAATALPAWATPGTRSSSATATEPCPAPTPGQQPEPGARSCLSVQAINPSAIGTGAPKVSDKSDGVDAVYDLVATVTAPFEGMTVTASLTGAAAQQLGELEQVPASPDTWVLGWDVPESVPEGSASIVFEVRDGSDPGSPVLASDTVSVDIQHKDHPPPPVPNPVATDIPAMETAALTWPVQGGELGFYRAPGARWTTVVSGLLSAGSNGTYTVYYSNTPLGWEPTWTSCATGSNPAARPEDGARPFRVACALAEGHDPSSVTAVAVVPQRTVSTTTGSRVDVGAADAHRVHPFVQVAAEMNVSIRGVTPATPTLAWPSGSRRTAGSGCLDLEVVVTDRHGQPVQGANVDVELVGPADPIGFGSGASTAQVPTGLPEQDASNCSQGGTSGKQGFVEAPDGPDAKRLESDKGSGLSGGGAGLGAWRFKVFSPQEHWGLTSVTAWVDEEPQVEGTPAPGTDNELLDPSEPRATASLTWLEKNASISLSTATDFAPVDSCEIYEVKVSGGAVPVSGANVDIHLRGPAPEARFCDAGTGTDLRAPDAGGHGTTEQPGGDSHPSNTSQCTTTTGPACQHREAETDDEGRLAFGLSSEVPGATTVTVWLDGESGHDDDLNNLTGAAANLTTNWIGSASDAKLSFTNPSAYAGLKTISDAHFRIVLSTDVPYIVPGADLELVSGTNAAPLGRAEKVAGGNTLEFDWDLDDSLYPGATEPGSVPDGSYTLKARIPDTGVIVQSTIAVDRTQGSPQEAVPPEGVEILTPVSGMAVAADGQSLKVSGVATKGAEGVDLFYTISLPGRQIAWVATRCGYVDLLGTGSQPQTFEGICTIPAIQATSQVTGLAAVSLDCAVAGCDASPTASLPGGRGTGGAALDSGDAINVDVCSAAPCLRVGPAESVADVGACSEVFIQVAGVQGAIEGAEVLAELEGPGESPSFCGPSTPTGRGSSSSSFRGTTDAQGSLQVGVTSPDSSFDSIYAPVESGLTRLTTRLDGAEGTQQPTAVAVFHWLLPDRCTVIGTPGDDELFATSFPDKICGLGGNDIIHGLDGLTGNDLILGGPGDDTIYANRGDDVVRGGPGDDVIFGGHGIDRLFGGSGNDELFGDQDEDQLHGGKGDDGCHKGKQGATKRSCERKASVPPEEEES